MSGAYDDLAEQLDAIAAELDERAFELLRIKDFRGIQQLIDFNRSDGSPQCIPSGDKFFRITLAHVALNQLQNLLM